MNSIELRQAIRAKYAWPGGYDLLFVCSDGSVLCADCTRQEYRQVAYARRHNLTDGWRVDAVDHTGNCDDAETCAHCGKAIGAEDSPAIEVTEHPLSDFEHVTL